MIDELFLANQKSPYADTYAAIMAIRFQGTEGDVIPRSALVESLHHVLDRKDLADLVIPDLARWSDWSQIDRLTKLFIEADPENNWVRVPVVNYLRACPEPAAKAGTAEIGGGRSGKRAAGEYVFLDPRACQRYRLQHIGPARKLKESTGGPAHRAATGPIDRPSRPHRRGTSGRLGGGAG